MSAARHLLTAFVAIATALSATAAWSQSASYQVTDLGTTFSPSKLNDKRQVVGTMQSTASIWRDGVITFLPPVVQGKGAQGVDITPTGTVVGAAGNVGGQNVAFRWIPDSPNGTTGATTAVSGPTAFIFGTNDRGDIAGRLFNSVLAGSYPVVWLAAGGINRPLGFPSTGDIGGGQDVNNNGDVVGFYSPSQTANTFGFFKPNTASAETALRLSGDSRALARRVNDLQEVVGESSNSSENTLRAFYYNHKLTTFPKLFALPLPQGFPVGAKSSAYDISEKSKIVGFAEQSAGISRAILWEKNANGVFTATDLNSLLPDKSGWTLTQAVGINTNGDIVGLGSFNGETHAYLLTTKQVFKIISVDTKNVSVEKNDKLNTFITPDTITLRAYIGEKKADVKVEWSVTGIGAASEVSGFANQVNRPTDADGISTFSFRPADNGLLNFDRIKNWTNGSRDANTAIGFDVVAYETAEGGDILKTRLSEAPELGLIKQNEKDRLRQEYVDYGLLYDGYDVPTYDKVVPTLNSQYGPKMNEGNYTVQISDQLPEKFATILSAYSGHTFVINGHTVQISGTASLTVSSGYRNPQRNHDLSVGGKLSPPSKHILGKALDLVPSADIGKIDGKRQFIDIDMFQYLYPILFQVAQGAGKAIAETNKNSRGERVALHQITGYPNSTEKPNHIHVQW